jgi:hypothetical protein
MAYRPHSLIAFGGTLNAAATSDEIWECTIRAITPGGTELPLSDPGGYMDELAPGLATWFGAPGNGCWSGSHLTWLKVNNIGADGRYSDPTTHQHDYTSPVAGGTGGQAGPSFLSLAISWTTSRTRPPGAFGRIYPPNFTWPLSGGSTVSAATQDSARDSGVALLEFIRNCEGDLGAIPVIASKTNATNTEINGVRVGNVYDVQRRRKNAVRETYEAVAWDSSCS